LEKTKDLHETQNVPAVCGPVSSNATLLIVPLGRAPDLFRQNRAQWSRGQIQRSLSCNPDWAFCQAPQNPTQHLVPSKWRGVDEIPQSQRYLAFDSEKKFGLVDRTVATVCAWIR